MAILRVFPNGGEIVVSQRTIRSEHRDEFVVQMQDRARVPKLVGTASVVLHLTGGRSHLVERAVSTVVNGDRTVEETAVFKPPYNLGRYEESAERQLAGDLGARVLRVADATAGSETDYIGVVEVNDYRPIIAH